MENEGLAMGPSGGSQAMLLHVLQALQRLDRSSERRPSDRRGGGTQAPPSVVLKMSPGDLALCHRGGAEESQTWCHFPCDRLFKEYRIESRRDNKIDLEVPIANLLHVFTSCASSDRTAIRLANGRDGRPILGFEFSLAGNVADHKVEQEVPVRVLAEAEANVICEPALPEPEYQIELPSSLQRIKNVLEKMKSVGAQHVLVEAARDSVPAGTEPGSAIGQTGATGGAGRAWLKFTAEAELVSIATTFPSLSMVMEGKKTPPPDGPVRLFLSLRRMVEVLAAMGIVCAEAHIACVLQDRALVLYALLPNRLGSLISYTPAVLT